MPGSPHDMFRSCWHFALLCGFTYLCQMQRCHAALPKRPPHWVDHSAAPVHASAKPHNPSKHDCSCLCSTPHSGCKLEPHAAFTESHTEVHCTPLSVNFTKRHYVICLSRSDCYLYCGKSAAISACETAFRLHVKG